MTNFALLVVRAVLGLLMAGHGAQKLFGWFGGPGLDNTAGWMESIGLKPGKQWALLGGASEFGGGVLTLLGFLNPFGPLGVWASMAMAARKVHGDQPIWATEGGAELPVTNMAAATALLLSGPGAISLDRLFGVRLPRWIAPVGLIVAVIVVAYAVRQSPPPPPQEEEEAREDLAGGAES